VIQNVIFRTLIFISFLLILFSKKGGFVFFRTFLNVPLFAYGLFIALSIVVSLVFYWSNRTSYLVFWGKRIMFYVFNSLLPFFISYAMAKHSEKTKKFLLYTFFLIATISSLYAILQYTGYEFIWPRNLHHYGSRSVSTFGNPNFLSSYLLVVIMLLVPFFFEASGINQFFFLFLILINYFALLITQTRSSWGGLFGAILLFFIFSFKKLKIKKVAIFFVAILFTTYIFPKLAYLKDHPTVIERVLGITKVQDKGEMSSVTQRLLIWRCALKIFKESPVIGHGWGSFELKYPFQQGEILKENPELAYLRTHANNAHNEILEQISQLGIFGFLLYCWIWFVFLKRSIKKVFKAENLLFLASFTAVLGFFADNLLNVTFNFPMPAYAFWIALGISVSFIDEGSWKVFKRSNLDMLAKAALVFVGVILVVGQIRYFLGEIYYFKGFTWSRRGMLKKAADSCLKSWKYYKYNTDNNYELGNCYMRLNEVKKAIWAYKQALRANHGYDEIYFNLAVSYEKAGDLENAEKNFLMAVKINPVSYEYFLALGNFYIRSKKNFELAEKYYQIALTLKPDSKDVLNNLGYLYLLKGETERSYESYKKSLEVDPSYEPARKNIIIALNRMNVPIEKMKKRAAHFVNLRRWKKAEQVYRELFQYNPGDVEAAFFLANCLIELKKFDEAMEIYKKLVKFFPQELNFRLNLAKVYIMRKENQKARGVLESALREFPDNDELKKLLRIAR